MTHVTPGSIARSLARCVLALGVLAASGVGALAQSAEPPESQVPASPCPSGGCLATPTPLLWPPVQFLGGRAVPVITSTCGVPGVDTFHLVATDGLQVDEFDLVLEPWDPSFMGLGWPGSVS